MLVVTDPDAFERRTEKLFERLRRERIDPCKKCGGVGTIVVKTVWKDDIVPIPKTAHCACKSSVLFDLDLFEAGVPRDLWRADEIEAEFNAEHFELLSRYGDQITGVVQRDGLSLLLSGENGTGKTSSACVAVIKALRANVRAALVSWPDYVNAARQTRFDARQTRRMQNRLRRSLLVIDEIGKESKLNGADDFPQQQLDSLIRSRRGERKPTILITNLSVTEFFSRYGESVKSLIAPPYNVLTYEPGDYRVRLQDSWSLIEG